MDHANAHPLDNSLEKRIHISFSVGGPEYASRSQERPRHISVLKQEHVFALLSDAAVKSFGTQIVGVT